MTTILIVQESTATKPAGQTATGTEALLDVTVLFALALAMALLIERFMEVLKAVFDLLDSRWNWHTFWTRRAKSIAAGLEKRLRIFQYVDPKKAASALQRFSDLILNEQGGYAGNVPLLAGDLVRTLYVKVASKIIGIGLGITLAFWSGINLLAIWNDAAAGSAWELNLAPWLSFILSGIAIGLGASPLHKIITTIERKREKRRTNGGQS
jgi:hypothetical protein